MIRRIQQALVEALGGTLLGDRASAASQDDQLIGFRPMTERAGLNRTRDLTILSHKEMIDLALWLYHTNALAEWLVDMPVALVVGQELGYAVAINAKDAGMTPDAAKAITANIREALDQFWYHPAHNISEKAPEYARTYLVTGHLVLPVTAVNPTSGIPQFDLIDAAQISGVVGLQGSAMVPGFVRFNPAGDIGQKEQILLVLQTDVNGLMLPQTPADPTNPEANTLKTDLELPPGAVLRWEGLYFRYNKLLNSLRGISYLMAIADWLDSLDQFTWASLDRAKLRNAIAYHLKLTGTSGLDLKKETDKLTAALTRVGSVYGSNEHVTVEAVAANLGSGDTVELGRMILTHILGSKSLPESWYSTGGTTNRATAGEQTDVAYKALMALQTRLRSIYRTMLWVAYDSAQAKQPAVFPKRTEAPWLTIEPNMPVIQERDMSRLAATVAQLVAGLGQAVDDEFISRQTSRKTVLDVMGQVTGGAYELDVEEALIKSEAQERAKLDAQAAADAARARLAAGLGGDGGSGGTGGGAPPSAASAPAREARESAEGGLLEAVAALASRPAVGELHVHTPDVTMHVDPPDTVVHHTSEIHVPAAAVTVEPSPPTPVEVHQHTTVEPAPVTVVPGQAPIVLNETIVAPTPPAPVIVQNDVHVPPPSPTVAVQEVERNERREITKTTTTTRPLGE